MSKGVERNNNTYTCCVLIHVKGVKSTYTECNCTTVIVFTKQVVSNKMSQQGCSGGQHPFPKIAVVVGGWEHRHYVRYCITRETTKLLIPRAAFIAYVNYVLLCLCVERVERNK